MNISKIQTTTFRNTNLNPTQQNQVQSKKPEFIDKVTALVQNQRDVNDCVAVPRGIFKAYLWIMSGAGFLGIASALPDKLKFIKSPLVIAGNMMYIISAFFFAKPFAFKGVSPTVDMKEMNK